MIYYFSATGNSKHVANRLAESLNESVTPVLEVLTLGIKVDDRMILVYPNYCGGVPSVIREFLQKNIFQISKDAKLILVITYGNNTGASSSIATKYFKKNTGRIFDAMYSVKMPDNWTPVFDLTNAEEVAEINRKADEEIDGIIRKIKMGIDGDHVNDKRSIVPVALTTGQAEHPAVCRTHPPAPEGENRAEARTHFKTKKEESMSENRKRNVTLTIRVTPAEKDAILKKAKQADMTLTDYLVTSALSANIYVAEDLKPALTELKRIGNNLNQITTRINMGVFQSYNFSEVIQGQRKLYEALTAIGGKPWRP